MIELGKKARDKITGVEGIITGRSSYIYGCDQYCIVPKSKDGMDIPEGNWYDEGRIELIEGGIEPKEVQSNVNGGPHFNPTRH